MDWRSRVRISAPRLKAPVSGAFLLRVVQIEKLGLECRYVIRDGLSDDEKRDLMLSLNFKGRQLLRQQKRKLIEVELTRDSSRLEEEIASVCAVDSPYEAMLKVEEAAH
jgi:hypothetical protein